MKLTGMDYVDVCPDTEAGIKTASKRLDCKNDTYNNSQYMCLPNVEKSFLVEFCFPGTMGIELKGSCLEASYGRVIRHDCSRFSRGCPDVNFYKYNAYKYKECQQINKQRRCYIADPSCQPEVTNQNEIGSSAIYAGIGTGVTVLIIMIIVIACILRYIRNKPDQNHPSNPDELKALNNPTQSQSGRLTNQVQSPGDALNNPTQSQSGRLTNQVQSPGDALTIPTQSQSGGLTNQVQSPGGALTIPTQSQSGGLTNQVQSPGGGLTIQAQSPGGTLNNPTQSQSGALTNPTESQSGGLTNQVQSPGGALNNPTQSQGGALTNPTQSQSGGTVSTKSVILRQETVHGNIQFYEGGNFRTTATKDVTVVECQTGDGPRNPAYDVEGPRNPAYDVEVSHIGIKKDPEGLEKECEVDDGGNSSKSPHFKGYKEFGYPLQEILDQLNKNSTHQQSSSKQDLDEDQPVTVSLQSKANEDVNDSKST